MVDMKSIGERIKHYREARDWTQDRLAAELNVSRQAVSKWEVGMSLPDTDCLVRLAKLFATTIDELLTGEPIESSTGRETEPEDQDGEDHDYVHDYRYTHDPDDDREDEDRTEIDLDVILGLAPIVGTKALNAMLESVPPDQFEFWHIHSLGPFAGGKVLSNIVRKMRPGRIGYGELQSLRAFVDGDAIDEYAAKSSFE